MDSNYIISRLKSTPFKYPTVALLRSRMSNLDEERKYEIVSNLKKQLYMERNVDIQEPLEELLFRSPIAS